MNSEKTKNYTIENTFKFLPFGYEVKLNFKEKQILENKYNEFYFFLISNFLDVEISNFKELKNKKGIISDKIFTFTYPKDSKAGSNEVLFLKGKKDDDEIILTLKSTFHKSKKPNNYYFKIEREFKHKPDFYDDSKSLKENLLLNEIKVETFRLSLLLFKSGRFGSIFGPTIGEVFCLELFENKLKVQITKSGIKNKDDIKVEDFYLFSKVNEIYNEFCE